MSLSALKESLRQAFATEIAERLPRIEALADTAADTAAYTDLEAVRRDVHTLASSACVVEELEIARLARAVEDDLLGGPHAELVVTLRAFLTPPAATQPVATQPVATPPAATGSMPTRSTP